jgi:hypothetical protein
MWEIGRGTLPKWQYLCKRNLAASSEDGADI